MTAVYDPLVVGMYDPVRSPMSKRPGGGAAPLPYTLDADLTSSLPASITFTRSGARNYITGGVLTALATGLPAFESWGGVNRGLAIEPGFTNLIKHSNTFTDPVWTYTGASTAVSGDAGLGELTQWSMMAATATTSVHMIRQKPGSQAAGLQQTFQGFVDTVAGATNYSCYLRMSNEFNNNGLVGVFRLDGNDGWFPVQDTTMLTGGMFHYRKLADGYLVGITGTWVSTGNKQVEVGVTANATPAGLSYTALTSHKVQMYGLSLATTPGLHGYVATGAATASQAEESAIFNDTSWLTTTQGTFVIEHDCWSGPLIGSGANTILGATVPGKTAIAWDGSTSDTVNNGGDAAAGGLPTFSGSDVRLLATSGVKNCGHVKSIRFYPIRLSVPEMQELTSPTVVSTANPGTLRTVSVDNRMPAILNTTVGTALTFRSRFRAKLGGAEYLVSGFKPVFPNIHFAAMSSVGNDIHITKAALERVTGVAECAPVYYMGARNFTVPMDQKLEVDTILPSAFTGFTTNPPADCEFWWQVEGYVTTAGHKFPGCRVLETGSFAKVYDPATVTYSDVDTPGPVTKLSGTDVGALTQGYCPLLLGTFVTGDPVTAYVIGDSLLEGTGSLATMRTYMQRTLAGLGIPNIEMSNGGKDQFDLAVNVAGWVPYTQYARVLIDALGTNDPNAVLSFFDYWDPAVNTYGIDKIMKVGLYPRSTSTDSWATEANQTVVRANPSNFPDLAQIEWLKYGLIDYNWHPQSILGTNISKWKTPGYTTDGTHTTILSDAELETEGTPIMAAITVT